LSEKNYIKLKKKSAFYSHFAFVDTQEYLADGLFIHEKVRVRFGSEFFNKKNKYVIICCKVRRSDESKFLRALERLESKMLLMGYKDYLEFCKTLLEEIGG